MSFLSRLLPGLGLAMRAERAVSGVETLVTLPPRDSLADATDEQAIGLIPIYRALQILTTSAGQLSITAERGGKKITDRVPGLARKPDPDMDRSDWIEQAVLSLALDGNLFLRKVRNPDGTVASARILPPAEVMITRDPKSRALTYNYRGEKMSSSDVQHQTLMRLPGHDRGIGPIQAARREIGGAADIRDYASNWFHGSGQPTGVLTVQKAQTADEAREARKRWNEAAADPENPTGIRVLGSGSTYEPLLLNPADAQWLEVRSFTVTDLARLFGIPSALMLVALEGNSLTYSNVEQEWLAFVRFTLMQYVRKIEEALTELSPAGQVIRFNLDTLLRSDTTTRYGTYRTGIESGFLTVDEVRALEGMEPLTDAQRAQIAVHQSAPAQEASL